MTSPDNSFGNSFQFTENNILGTHSLLEASKVHNIKRFVHVSTDEVYGEIEEGEGVCSVSLLHSVHHIPQTNSTYILLNTKNIYQYELSLTSPLTSSFFFFLLCSLSTAPSYNPPTPTLPRRQGQSSLSSPTTIPSSFPPSSPAATTSTAPTSTPRNLFPNLSAC